MLQRKTKYFLILLQLVAPVLVFLAVPQQALAATPAGCIWDHDGVVSTFTTPEDAAGCVEALLFDQNVPAGSYWHIEDFRERESPCRNNSRIRQVTAQEFMTLATRPATSSSCGSPPPPPDINNVPGSTGAPTFAGSDKCGSGSGEVNISINIGCGGQGNAIIDALFAIIRVLSAGVGIVIIASTIYAGIQYSSSRADPGQIAQATERLRNNIIALLVFLFMFAILNWLTPGGLLT